MAEMNKGRTGVFGLAIGAMNAGFHPFYPNFRKVESIYLSEDETTLMVNTNYSTTFFKGLEKIEMSNGEPRKTE